MQHLCSSVINGIKLSNPRKTKCVAAGRAIKISFSLERWPKKTASQLGLNLRKALLLQSHNGNFVWLMIVHVDRGKFNHWDLNYVSFLHHKPPKKGNFRVSKMAESFQHAVFSLPPDQRWCKRLKGGQDWQTEVCKFIAGGEQEDQHINTRPKCQGNVAKKLKGNPHRSSTKSTDVFMVHSYLQRECGPEMPGLPFQITGCPMKTRGIREESPPPRDWSHICKTPFQDSRAPLRARAGWRSGTSCKTLALPVKQIYTKAERWKHDAQCDCTWETTLLRRRS